MIVSVAFGYLEAPLIIGAAAQRSMSVEEFVYTSALRMAGDPMTKAERDQMIDDLRLRNWSTAEIAKRIGTSPETVRRRINRMIRDRLS